MEKAKTPIAEAGQWETKAMRMMVDDDSEAMADVAARVMEDVAHFVLCADCVASALNTLASPAVDERLRDINRRGTDGHAPARHMQSSPQSSTRFNSVPGLPGIREAVSLQAAPSAWAMRRTVA